MNIWIINPYGSLPDEPWRTYRSTMLASALVKAGHNVEQFISNFEHRSKSFRSERYLVRHYGPMYSVHIIPSSSYHGHISLDRVRYERSFAKNIIRFGIGLKKPDVVILAEPALCYYDILVKWIKDDLEAKIVIDLIDIWPELFHLLFPQKLNFIANILLSPLYYWRSRLYKQADGFVAVAKNYLDIGLKIKPFKKNNYAVVYWSIPDAEVDKEIFLNDAKIKRFIEHKQKSEVWCIYAGTLGENYDIKSIIEVGRKMKSSYGSKRFKLFVAGDGPLNDYCEISSDGSSIIFLGRLGSDDLAGLFKSCDFALSTYKGRSTVAMPIKAFDYLAFGLPLINSLGRDLGALINNHNVGLNYIPESVEDLYRAVSKLVDDEGLRIDMRKNALQLSKDFSEEKQYAKFVTVIENVFYEK